MSEEITEEERRRIIAEFLADYYFQMKQNVPLVARNNKRLLKQVILKRFDYIETHVIGQIHIWLQENEYCPHFKKS